MGDSNPPALVVTVRAIRNDNSRQGYQMIVYADYYSPKPRVQAYIVDFSKESRWRACLNAQVLNSHEAEASLKWGQNCQDYKIIAKAQTGHLGSQPALKVTVAWPKVPSKLRSAAGYMAQFVPGAAYMLGFSEKYKKNAQHQARLIVALSSPRTVDVLVHFPKMTMYYTALRLPVPIPVRRISQSEILQAPTWNIFAEAPQILKESLQGECKVSENQITTFDGINLAQELPESCYHILSQDCSDELKFMVMAKKSSGHANRKDINIKLGHYDITMSRKTEYPEITINNNVVAMKDLPYKSFGEPTVEIYRTETGVSLIAPDYGIESLTYDGENVQMQPTLAMKGQLCGICGHNDDETERAFRRPDGTVAEDETSHIHSWILPSESCAEGCNVQPTLVKLDKEIYGEKSKCYSVHPVLRCKKDCSPVKTAQVTTGFHCLPFDTALDFAEGQTYLDKPEDHSEIVEAHTACSCTKCSA